MCRKKWVQTDEPRLIDGKKLYRALIQFHKHTTDKHDVQIICRCMNFVKSQKTIQFPYVNCISCKYFEKKMDVIGGVCKRTDSRVVYSDFCSYSERQEESE